MKAVLKKLTEIQCELKAPKGQRNTFGKYNYRSAEDILEAVKPLLLAKNVTLHATEDLKTLGLTSDSQGQAEILCYIESKATLFDVESGESISSSASAIVDLNAKGMQKPQQTGSASSYAKKYALGNLLLLDDTKDADSLPVPTVPAKPQAVAKTPPAKPTATQETKKAAKQETSPKLPATSKTSGKEDAKKSMTDIQKENFLKGVSEGKFALVEKHLNNYAQDAKVKEIQKALVAAKSGKA